MSEPVSAIEILMIVYIVIVLKMFTTERKLHSALLDFEEKLYWSGLPLH